MKYELSEIKEKILKRGDLSYISVIKQLEYLEKLQTFPLGQDLLKERMFNPLWTDYIICDIPEETSCELERFILCRSPFVRAWRELFLEFKRLMQESLKNGIVIASIPCGLMRDIFTLDFTGIKNYQLLGVDIDFNVLAKAKALSEKYPCSSHVRFMRQDAWALGGTISVDVIASCGLNIYVENKEKEIALYRSFFQVLRPGGKLLISFLTPPPSQEWISEWNQDEITEEEILMDKVLYEDILGIKCRNFRDSETFKACLRELGFTRVEIFMGKLGVFPVAVAYK